ncbi:hypothetical protein [Deinococcus aluminii]|uniref:DUF1772 domain-containing protein n=1 Tax=Deinococcus aluminii TaxID=1656885 RepID=A0ABP9XBP6_9DEIO
MRPDEWREGMENEAASVEDEAWSRETRWAAGQRSLGGDVLLASVGALSISGLYWWLWLGMVRCNFGLTPADSYGCWVKANMHVLDPVVPYVLLTGIGLALGLGRVRLSVAAAVFLLIPVFVTLVAAALQLIAPPSDIIYGQGEHLNLMNYTPRRWHTILSQSLWSVTLVFPGTWLGERLRRSFRRA